MEKKLDTWEVRLNDEEVQKYSRFILEMDMNKSSFMRAAMDSFYLAQRSEYEALHKIFGSESK